MGALPFPDDADLIERPDTLILSFPIAVWPSGPRVGAAGDHYDHLGEAPLEVLPHVAVANRVIVSKGSTYVVVEATPHAYLPHVALRLRRSTGTGV